MKTYLRTITFVVAAGITVPSFAQAAKKGNLGGVGNAKQYDSTEEALKDRVDRCEVKPDDLVKALKNNAGFERSSNSREAAQKVLNSMPEKVRDNYTLVEEGGRFILHYNSKELAKVSIPSKLTGKFTARPDLADKRLDSRSRLVSIMDEVDAATLAGADVSYDIDDELTKNDPESALDSTGTLRTDLTLLTDKTLRDGTPNYLQNYSVGKIYADTYSGFKAVVFEYKTDDPALRHRIYAVAGTNFFENTDYRDWASGMTMGRIHYASDAALIMASDAANYAMDPNGGEVLVTGQSQGGMSVQGTGFIIQSLINARGGQNYARLVHQTSWGAVGGLESIEKTLDIFYNAKKQNREYSGAERGIDNGIEAHRGVISKQNRLARPIWNELGNYWLQHQSTPRQQFIKDVANQQRVIAYFFEIDLGSRVGTFLGTSYIFPINLMIPLTCESLKLDHGLGRSTKELGTMLESHFLNAYHRAIARGGLKQVISVDPEKWSWMIDLQRKFDWAGVVWAEGLYKDTLGESDWNWNQCRQKATEWRTNLKDARMSAACTADYQDNCDPKFQKYMTGSAKKGIPLKECLIIKVKPQYQLK